MKEAIQAMKVFAPKAEQPIMLDGVGHWIQHEAPEETNEALAAFFKRAAAPGWGQPLL
jgi:pimeloyl-ACP methyl ester carboxylesterase